MCSLHSQRGSTGVESGLTYNLLNPTTESGCENVEWLEFMNIQFQRHVCVYDALISRAEVACRWRQVQLSAVGFKSIH